MNNNFVLLVRVLFIFLDLLLLNIIFFSAKWLMLEPNPYNEQEYLYFWIFINLEWLGCSYLYSLYHGKFTNRLEPFVRQTLHTYFMFVVLILVYLYFSRQIEISRAFVSMLLLAFPASLLLIRMFYMLMWMHVKRRDHLMKRVLIIGYNEIGKKLASYFELDNTHVQVVGYCEEYNKVLELSNYPIVNTPVNAVRASKEFQVTDIYSTILPEQDKRIYDLMNLADQACIRFKLVPDFSLFVNRPMHVDYLSGMAVLSPRPDPLDDIANRIKKRFFDIVISSLIAIFILSWLMPLIALAIWLNSRGPIFFIQKRSGVNNKPFNCIKFRSMYVNNDAHLQQARRSDARMTSVGKFIRKTSLDELPQFFNVLKGDMSIVGPRPHMIKHTEDYSAVISNFLVRQFVKPGITGWAQVNGHRGETRTTEKMQLRVDHDLWYMENWSLFLDFKIIFLTVYNVIKGEKNAF